MTERATTDLERLQASVERLELAVLEVFEDDPVERLDSWLRRWLWTNDHYLVAHGVELDL